MADSGRTPIVSVTLMIICALLAAQQEKINGYADEVKDERIARSEII